jgi:8-amino-7-oxononanoate synthase
MTLFTRWRKYLEGLHAQGRYRRLAPPRGLDFSSNDYLGYAKISWPTPDNLSRSGQASRLLRGQHPPWEEVEANLAHWHGAEAALVMNSGYLANEGLLSALLEADDFIASDQLNHASIIDGIRLSRAERFIFRHNDLGHLEEGLRTAAQNRRPSRELFVVTEALFGMEADRAPLLEMVQLADKYQAHLIVDEAHSTGCFGPEGSGLVDELGLRSRVLATIHTGGKALGVAGAYICCPRLLRDLLVNRCRHFIFTTALPPAVASWWLAMLPHVRRDEKVRQSLHHNAALFRQKLHETGMTALGQDYIVPVILGDDTRAVQVAEILQSEGFDIRAIRPPTVAPGTARLRISIHADHTSADLEAVANCLRLALANSP